MSELDPLDVAAELLVAGCPEKTALIQAAIGELRRVFGGAKVYINSNCQARQAAILDALAGGASVREVAKRFGLTVQAIGYVKRKKRSTERCS